MADQDKNRGSSGDDRDREEGMEAGRSRPDQSGSGITRPEDGMGDEEELTRDPNDPSRRTGSSTGGAQNTGGSSGMSGSSSTGGSTGGTTPGTQRDSQGGTSGGSKGSSGSTGGSSSNR